MKIGDKFELTEDALENYGAEYKDKVFTVSHVATAYMPAKEFYAKGSPNGFHPGYDNGVKGQSLYDSEELNFSVYDWEVNKL